MGAADKEIARAERTDDLRRARDERYYAFVLNIGQLDQMLLSGRGTHQRLSGTGTVLQ